MGEMSKVIFSLILLVTFFTATAAELACDCFAETAIHQDLEKHADTNEQNDHCHHVCTQCHFVAVVPSTFVFASFANISFINFDSAEKNPIAISLIHFRPPIA
jgi:hypothetical protein